MAVESVVSHRPDTSQFFFLSDFIKDLFSGTDLVLCHLTGDLHTPLIQLYNLPVDFINPLPKLTQIHFSVLSVLLFSVQSAL